MFSTEHLDDYDDVTVAAFSQSTAPMADPSRSAWTQHAVTRAKGSGHQHSDGALSLSSGLRMIVSLDCQWLWLMTTSCKMK